MKKALFFLMTVGLITSAGFAQVLLDDTFADGDRTETGLPGESAVWVSHPASAVTTAGSLAFTQSTGSQKMWTYFAADGAPVSVGVGQQLKTTIQFAPGTTLYDVSSKNFRFGLFNDPTSPQSLADFNSDSGGTGNPWADSTGYAVHFPLSSGPASGSNGSLGKRITGLSTSLLGSGSAYPNMVSGGNKIYAVLDTVYTLTLELDRIAADQMKVTFAIADDAGVISTNTITDDGTFGGYNVPIYTSFDQLFFRFSAASGTADVLDFQSIKVELIPEPATMALLGLGSLVAIRRKK